MFDFGLRLRKLRKKAKLSQTQVAKRLGLKRQTISQYERNITTPSVNVLGNLALLYHVSADYLLGLDHRPNIVLDDLTARQISTMESVINTLLYEFKITNKELNQKTLTKSEGR